MGPGEGEADNVAVADTATPFVVGLLGEGPTAPVGDRLYGRFLLADGACTVRRRPSAAQLTLYGPAMGALRKGRRPDGVRVPVIL